MSVLLQACLLNPPLRLLNSSEDYLKLRLVVSCRILALVQHFRQGEIVRKNNLFCLSALLLAVLGSTPLGMATPVSQVSSQVAPRVEATASLSPMRRLSPKQQVLPVKNLPN